MDESHPVSLSRAFFQSAFWREEREYSRAEAWLDMIASATLAPEATKMVGGHRLSLTRGDLPASVRYLAHRWTWSKSKVERFLTLLRDMRLIRTRIETGQNIITICELADSPNPPPRERDTGEDTRGTVARQSRDKVKKLTLTPTANVNGARAHEASAPHPLPLPLQVKPPSEFNEELLLDQEDGFTVEQRDLWRMLLAEIASGGKKGKENFMRYLPFWRKLVIHQPLALYNGVASHHLLRDNPRHGPHKEPGAVIIGEMKRTGWRPGTNDDLPPT